MIKAIKYVNAKLNTKKKRKWWSDFLFNYTMLETVNNISK